MKFNTKYKYDKVQGFHFSKPSLTDQSQAFDADINNIVNGMALTPQQAQEPIFGIEVDHNMYENALNVVAQAKSDFEKLPAHIRREFDNDPTKLIAFMDNPKMSEDDAKKGVNLGIFNSSILQKYEKKTNDTIVPTSPQTPTAQAIEPVSQ